MRQFCIFITVLLATASAVAQAEKDSLLKVHADSIYQRIVLMHYLDQKALQLQIMDKQGRFETDFKAYYADSILATNPTDIDISAYLGFKQGKQPKRFKKFVDAVYEANALEVLKLTEQYGYLSAKRTGFKIGGQGVSILQYTFRSGKYHKDIAEIFEAENKSGNMSGQDFFIFYYYD